MSWINFILWSLIVSYLCFPIMGLLPPFTFYIDIVLWPYKLCDSIAVESLSASFAVSWISLIIIMYLT